jgi:hypothetical protein
MTFTDMCFTTRGNNLFKLHIPARGDFESFFIFSAHKCGSTLLNRIWYDVAKIANLPIIDLEGSMFQQGFVPNDIVDDLSPVFLYSGYCYLGFRSFWPIKRNINFNFSKVKSIVLVRDIRDAMVSHYFSTIYSHTIPKMGPTSKRMKIMREKTKTVDINKYVLDKHFIEFYKSEFETYLQMKNKPSRFYRYEDIIFYKREWIDDMLNYIGIDIKSSKLDKIIKKHDIIPSNEDLSQHIRQVIPGNYRKHLSNSTIIKINSIFKNILKTYGYLSVQNILID